ncbi:MAG: S1 RNA-binding domain-containing protein [Oscillospiraceae bacterium]|nr:S1 RNA-binding domain-containing protein [Oscillospiraceae bacterium]
MDLVVGSVYDGKVTGITKFGAFVLLPGGRSGLVHISEIAYTYVSDVKDHLQEGQQVKVKLISIDDNGHINLSIKKAMDPPPPVSRPARSAPQQSAPKDSASSSFEDKLKRFMVDSDSKMSDLRQYSDKRSSGSRRRK